jgi:hypothetical protein
MPRTDALIDAIRGRVLKREVLSRDAGVGHEERRIDVARVVSAATSVASHHLGTHNGSRTRRRTALASSPE